MPNLGQLWASTFQYGRETVSGTPVLATRKAYFDPASMLSVEQAANEHRFAVGRPDNLLSVTPGPVTASGTISLPVSSDELVELFLIALKGAVTPTVPVGGTLANLWNFKPGGNLDSATFEWDDGASVWQGAGVQGNGVTITGDASGTNMVSSDLFATDVIAMPGGVVTPALADRVPDFLEGWQTRLYIGTFGQAFSALTLMPGLLRNWTVTIANALGRVRTADNTLATRRIVRGQFSAGATLTFDAYGTGAITEFNNWRANTRRAVGLEFVGPASGIEAGVSEVQTMTLTTPVGNILPVFMGTVGAGVPSPYTAAALQTSLRAIPAIGSDGVTVAGANGGPFTITFAGRWAEYNVSAITGTMSTSGTVAVVETTPGRSGRRSVQILLPGNWISDSIGGSADEIRTYEMGLTAIYDPTLAAMLEVRLLNNRTTAFA